MDSPNNDKVRPKSLRERAAEISVKVGKTAKNRDKSKVAKDAGSAGNQAVTQQVSRVTRQQASQNGGAHVSQKSVQANDSASSESQDKSAEDSPANIDNPKDGGGDASSSNQANLIDEILRNQRETHGRSSSPPAKRAREDPPPPPRSGESQENGLQNSPSGS